MVEQVRISGHGTGFPLKNGYKTCYSALQEVFALESAVENDNIQDNPNSGMFLAPDNIKEGKK